ncbi:MAG: RHS repeat-associated core domain-containing protein [Nitrospirae bacterium]|nr:RHS repeat-associated core domain-containing protein [Nitrospirota bacterium]
MITDQDGVSIQSIYYYPYGETHTNSGPDVARHKFTGQEYDAETGLYYYNARYYDPKLARFITADTIVPEPFDPQALNRYSYVINNPVMLIDPSGHYSDDYYCCGGGDGGDDYWGSDPWDDGGDSSDEWWDYYGDYSEKDGGNNPTPDPAPAPTPELTPAPPPTPAPTPMLGNNDYGAGLNINNINLMGGWYSGIIGHLNDRTVQNILEGRNAAAWIDQIGIEAIDLLLPQSAYEVPLMLMPLGREGKYGMGEIRNVLGAWSNGTFRSAAASIRYHYNKHGIGQGIESFTKEAMEFLNVNKAIARPHLLRTGEEGLKISTKTHFGVYTKEGKIVTYGGR